MRATRKIGWNFLAAHGALMLCLGLALCALASLMARPALVQISYILAVVLSASCLLGVGVYFAAITYSERSNLSSTPYIMAGLLSIASWLALWLIRSTPSQVALLSLLAGAHGILWGLWYLRLAFHLKFIPRKAVFLCILGATASFLGIVLSTQSEISQLEVVSAVSYFSMFLGVETLLTTLYLYSALEATARLPRSAMVSRAAAFERQPLPSMSHGIATQPQAEEATSGSMD